MALLFLSGLLLPALIIYLWERSVLASSPHSIWLYRITGLIGTPIHELAHAIGCIIFGLRITGMSLYCPSDHSNVMGYVSFRYRPHSVRHQIGSLVQGVAPLIAGGAIVTLSLGAQPIASAPESTLPGILNWVGGGALATLQALYDLAMSGLPGFTGAILLLCICLHAIPSIADIKISLGAFAALAVMWLVLATGLHVLLDIQMGAALELHFVGKIVQVIETGLWWLLSASVGVVTVAIAGSFLFVMAPALVIRLSRKRPSAKRENNTQNL